MRSSDVTWTGNEREIISRAFFPYFSRFFLTGFLPRFVRNFSRFYVRTMELWIVNCELWIPVSGNNSAITTYVKPFSPPELCSQPWLITALHNAALTGTPVDKIDNEVFQTETSHYYSIIGYWNLFLSPRFAFIRNISLCFTCLLIFLEHAFKIVNICQVYIIFHVLLNNIWLML
jgi:hypothetical protein